MTTSITG